MADDNNTLFKVAELIRLVTGMDQEEANASIVIGRSNILNFDYNRLLYVIDIIPSSSLVSAGQKFDGVNETTNFIELWRHDVTIDVYGQDAWQDALTLSSLFRSQLATDAKTSLGLTSFVVSSKTDLKELTGSQYINRVQLGCVVQNCEVVEIETLRIDAVQLRIINEKGTLYDSQS